MAGNVTTVPGLGVKHWGRACRISREKLQHILTMAMKRNMQPGVVVHACNPSTGMQSRKDHEFEASLGYRERSCLKNK
jgi:hypothetical protein